MTAASSWKLGPDREDAPVVRVPLQALRFHPRNIRTNLGDLTALAESIRHEGVLVPLMAEKRSSGGLRLLHGHRRWAAADIAGLRRVPCVIVPEHTDDEAIMLMLAENTGRAEVASTDLQSAIRTLMGEFDYDPSAIAQRLGVDVAVVRAWAAGRGSAPRGPAGRAPTGAPPVRRAPRRSASRQANPAPKIRPTAVHALLARWDAGDVDAAGMAEELRRWLGTWRPQVSSGS